MSAKVSPDWNAGYAAGYGEVADLLTLADALAAAVEAWAHPQHSGITGAFATCIGIECAAARAYRARRGETPQEAADKIDRQEPNV